SARAPERSRAPALPRSTHTRAFPFQAHPAETVGAQLEMFAQPTQHRGFLSIRIVLVGAGDVVGALALLAVIDEMIFLEDRAQPLQGFRINSRPEKSEVADVAVYFAAGAALAGHGLDLQQHLGDFFQPLALGILQTVQRIDVNEA